MAETGTDTRNKISDGGRKNFARLPQKIFSNDAYTSSIRDEGKVISKFSVFIFLVQVNKNYIFCKFHSLLMIRDHEITDCEKSQGEIHEQIVKKGNLIDPILS